MILTITKITPTFPTGVFIQWNLIPDPNITGNFLFTVSRSGSPGGPWAVLGTNPLINTISYLDNNFNTPDSIGDETNLLALNKELYYQVSVVDPVNNTATSVPVDLNGLQAVDASTLPTQDTQVSGTNLHKRQFLLRRKILRDESTALRVLNGVQLQVYKKMHFGQRCTLCYDPLTRASTLSHCPQCFGTSWIGGYYPPIPTQGRLSPASIQTSLTNEGLSDVSTVQFVLLNYPKVEADDLIVEPLSSRIWLVKILAPTELKRVMVHQRINCSELPRSDPEYELLRP